ncbi:MAG: helix-turn-helix transcriptional regulator, partial [Clostridia bacterium]
MSVGDVGRGVAGFRQSLREALDAQGVLFLPIGALRAYRPYDAQTADWLAYMRVSTMYDALRSEHADALALVLKRLEQAIAQRKPSLFTLRYMAALLDSFLPLALHADSEAKTPLRALWEDETLSREMWFAAFREKLLELHGRIDVPPADDHPPAVRQTLEIIRTRYAEPLSMNGVAGDLHMNPAYLGQLVRRHTGATFHQLLLDMRVSYACRLLRQTARAVGDIAMSVGFRDVDYFSQQFRRRMGMSPHAYRSPNQERQG